MSKSSRKPQQTHETDAPCRSCFCRGCGATTVLTMVARLGGLVHPIIGTNWVVTHCPWCGMAAPEDLTPST